MMKSIPSIIRFSTLIAALAALPSVCRALPYFGSFIQTIESSTAAGVYAGTQYYGYYTYESDTMDGTFVANWLPGNQTLNGYIYVPFAGELEVAPEPKPDGIPAYWSTLKNTSQFGSITIENGQVTNFHWSHEKGGFYMSAGLTSFMALSFYDYPAYENYADKPIVTGSMNFTGGPRVPDFGSSLCLLALGCLGLGFVRRRISSIVG